MNKSEVRNLIMNLVDKKINDIFIEVQDMVGITSGDTMPEQETVLDDVKLNLVKIILEIIEFELETNRIGE